MLRSMKDLENYAIGAPDGEVGHVRDFYFDDDAWVIRYLVVETGSWLASRRVLISPISIHHPDWAGKVLPVSISKAQVKNSPGIDTDKPVSRQHEMEYMGYYGYPYYWGGDGMWGAGLYPYALSPGAAASGLSSDALGRDDEAAARAERARHRNDDPHLRSCHAIEHYLIHATDGEIGHVEGLIVDEETWAIRYLVINTSNWWMGHKVLVAPQWIEQVSWAERQVAVNMSRHAIQAAPAWDAAIPPDRAQEIDIYKHYDRSGYW